MLMMTAKVFADVTGYGVVKLVTDRQIVVNLKDSTYVCTVDESTKVTGAVVVVVADWVYVDVDASGHLKTLRVEEIPKPRAGVVKEIRGNGDTLIVRSGIQDETWGVTPFTILVGIDRGQIRPGDDIGVKILLNNKIAQLMLIKRGVKN